MSYYPRDPDHSLSIMSAMIVVVGLAVGGLGGFLGGLVRAEYLSMADAAVLYAFLGIGAVALISWMFTTN